MSRDRQHLWQGTQPPDTSVHDKGTGTDSSRKHMFEDIKKFRHEHKYIEPEINLVGMQQRLGALMKKDPHVSEKGYYSIRSLYFDDYRDRFLNENIDGVDERSKWRIRIYDRSSDRISLERKIRKSDLISKQSCVIDICLFACSFVFWKYSVVGCF